MPAIGRVRISRADVGSRVTVRARIPAGPGEPAHSDTVGVLRDWSAAGWLEIQRRDGSIAHVREGDIVAARVVPS